jgi:hypothetical protein
MQTNPTIQPTTTQELTNYEKGVAFEKFIVDLFDDRNFLLLDWRSDKRSSKGIKPISSTNPDLVFTSKGKYKTRFAVECKWKSYFKNGLILWAEDYKIRNYDNYQFERQTSVLIAIGIGGYPDNPSKLYITPLDNIKMKNYLSEEDLTPYNQNPTRKIEGTWQLKLF